VDRVRSVARMFSTPRLQLRLHARAIEVGDGIGHVIDHIVAFGRGAAPLAGGAFKSRVRMMMKLSGTSLP